MMITVKTQLFFGNGVSTDALVESLRGLPDTIRPAYFTENEGKIPKGNMLTDEARFKEFRKKNGSLGFLLYSANKKTTIDITPRVGYAEVTLWLKTGSPEELVPVFFSSLVVHHPIFGFSCDYDEFVHRNRRYDTIGMFHMETWVGRKPEKHIPGVYWYTLLSDHFLTRHGVRLADLCAEAISAKNLKDGSLHLLKFFESPKDWKAHMERLDDLCERTDGVFSKRVVDAAIQNKGVMTYHEYNDFISQWI
jgi:hypothetical protein